MPRKLGQHFLVRDSVLEKLAGAACGPHRPRVVEIGSGRGALTRHLLPHTDELHVIEIDPNLVSHLTTTFSSEPKLHIHRANVLETDLAQWGPAVLVGNLPYYITSPIIEKFLALDSRFPTAVFLMQSEVAERITASPGTRDFGYLSVASQLLCHVRIVVHVPASAFVPPPKVESAAVLFERKTSVPDQFPDLLHFVGRSFAQKRKTLRNNLRPFYGAAADSLPEAGLRAEQLSVSQFIDLYHRLTASTRQESPLS